MDLFDERVLAALKDGEPKSFTALLSQVGFSHNALQQHLVSAVPYLKNALEKNVKVKIILPSDLPFPKGHFEQEAVKEYYTVGKKARRDGMLEERWVERVDSAVGVSDKLKGRVFFPTLEGHFDYRGFTVVDELSHKFCKDVFDYYWNKATTSIPNHVLQSYDR